MNRFDDATIWSAVCLGRTMVRLGNHNHRWPRIAEEVILGHFDAVDPTTVKLIRQREFSGSSILDNALDRYNVWLQEKTL